MSSMDEHGGSGASRDGGTDGERAAGMEESWDTEARPAAAGAAGAGGIGGIGGDGVAAYAAEVRAELADLPAAAVAELLEDLEDHLHEVAAEDDGDLRERLGSPAGYAAELRASAGLPERGTAAPSATPGRKRRRSPRELVAALEDRLRTQWLGREFLDFLPLLRPAWWVARAWLVVYLLQLMTYGDGGNGQIWLLPRPGGSELLGMLLLVLTVPASIWLARRPPFDGRRAQAFALAQAVLGVLAAVVVLHSAGDDRYYATPAGYAGPVALNEGGRPIDNLFVYDQSGKLLNGVYVYDQDGNPVGTVRSEGVPGFPLMYVDAGGNLVTNRFPLPQALVSGPDGVQVEAAPPPDVVIPQGVRLFGPGQDVGPGTEPASPTAPDSGSASGSTTATASPSSAASGSASGSASGTASASGTPSAPATPHASGTPSASRSGS